MNCDGSRGDTFGKLKIKDNTKLTNKQKDIINVDVGRRISETSLIDDISTIFHTNEEFWSS